jgi:drug/metabolite transporter (DMT)-like permease
MNERLTVPQLLLLTAYAIGMSGGQLLFKIAAMRPAIAQGTAVERLLGLSQNIPFLLALLLYAGFAVFWVWILSFTPLSRAYPFVALAFALTPLLGGLLFAEPISLRLLLGILLILAGLFLVAA